MRTPQTPNFSKLHRTFAYKHPLCPTPRKIIPSTNIVKWPPSPQIPMISLIFHKNTQASRHKHPQISMAYPQRPISAALKNFFLRKFFLQTCEIDSKQPTDNHKHLQKHAIYSLINDWNTFSSIFILKTSY